VSHVLKTEQHARPLYTKNINSLFSHVNDGPTSAHSIALHLGSHHVVGFLYITPHLCNRLMRITSILFAVMSKVAVT
jgi:hypothetical protein